MNDYERQWQSPWERIPFWLRAVLAMVLIAYFAGGLIAGTIGLLAHGG